jgi:hypothetical protein
MTIANSRRGAPASLAAACGIAWVPRAAGTPAPERRDVWINEHGEALIEPGGSFVATSAPFCAVVGWNIEPAEEVSAIARFTAAAKGGFVRLSDSDGNAVGGTIKYEVFGYAPPGDPSRGSA